MLGNCGVVLHPHRLSIPLRYYPWNSISSTVNLTLTSTILRTDLQAVKMLSNPTWQAKGGHPKPTAVLWYTDERAQRRLV